MTVILIVSILLGVIGGYLLSNTGDSPLVRMLVAVCLMASLILSSAYIIADQLTGNGIDNSVVFHLTFGMKGAPYQEFLPQIVGAAVLASVALLVGVFAYRRMDSLHLDLPKSQRYVGFFCVLLSVVTSPGTADIYKLSQEVVPITSEAPDAFLTVSDLGYIESPKNFILIFVESLEKAYFDETIFPGLLPNLTSLAREGTEFTNISQVRGTGWSIAGMAASLCGVPMVGAGTSNSMSGADQFLPLAVCLGDILQAEGYQLEHLVGSDTDFAGRDKLFRSHGFESVIGLEELSPQLPADTVYSSWGLHDETLLAVATERLEALSRGDSPFGMVLNTVDTHHPAGHPSPACQAEPYGDGESTLLTAFACTDRLVTQWVSDLRERGLLENTVLVISSDHLSMPNEVWDRIEGPDRRNFVMFLGDDIPQTKIDRSGSTLDLGPTLLNLIGYDTVGIGLGRNLLSDPEGHAFGIPDIESAIQDSVGYISSLWAFPTLNARITLNVEEKQLQIGLRQFSLPVLMQFDAEGATTKVDFQFYTQTPLSTNVLQMETGQKFLWFGDCFDVAWVFDEIMLADKQLCAAYGKYGTKDVWGTGFEELSAIDLSGLGNAVFSSEAGVPDIGRRLVHTASDEADAASFDGFQIISSGSPQGVSMIRARNKTDELVLPRGVSIVGLPQNGSAVFLDTADTCGDALSLENSPQLDFSIAETIEAHKDNYDMIAVVVHDSAICGQYTLEPFFTDSKLRLWEQIGFRTPYIALRSSQGDVLEKSGTLETHIYLTTNAIEN